MTDQYVCCICANNNGDIEVTKQKCGHIICWHCLEQHVSTNLAPKIKCPGAGCVKFLSDVAIRKVLSDEKTVEYESLSMVRIPQRVNCMLPGCPYSFICVDANLQFECTTCLLFNCVMCKAPHRRLNCQQFRSSDISTEVCQAELNAASQRLKQLNRSKYRQMFIDMDNNDLILYDNLLECPNCCRHLAKGDGIILRCSHLFCKYCLCDHIKMATRLPITCPSENCNVPFEEREILKLIPKENIPIYVDRCNARVKGKLELVFQCQSPGCLYFVTFSNKPNQIHCPICKSVNCTECHAIHKDMTCAQFKLTPYGKNILAIEEKIRRKELMRCMKCYQVLQKISGCSWIQCSNCGFEMCWALQMRRWGPGGRGDESDGCKCQLFGPRCAPDCESCEPHHEPGDPIDGRMLLNALIFQLLRGIQLEAP